MCLNNTMCQCGQHRCQAVIALLWAFNTNPYFTVSGEVGHCRISHLKPNIHLLWTILAYHMFIYIVLMDMKLLRTRVQVNWRNWDHDGRGESYWWMHKIHLNSPQKYTRNTRNTRQLFIKINICLPTLTAWESDKQGAALSCAIVVRVPASCLLCLPLRASRSWASGEGICAITYNIIQL